MSQIRIDCDNRRHWGRMRIANTIRILGLGLQHVRAYSTRNGYHFYLNVDRTLTGPELVCIQALMGSDHKREALNFLRVHSGEYPGHDRSWNILFAEKWENGQRISSEHPDPEKAADIWMDYIEYLDTGDEDADGSVREAASAMEQDVKALSGELEARNWKFYHESMKEEGGGKDGN